MPYPETPAPFTPRGRRGNQEQSGAGSRASLESLSCIPSTSRVPWQPRRRSGSRARRPLRRECVCGPRWPGRFSFFLSTLSTTCPGLSVRLLAHPRTPLRLLAKQALRLLAHLAAAPHTRSHPRVKHRLGLLTTR